MIDDRSFTATDLFEVRSNLSSVAILRVIDSERDDDIKRVMADGSNRAKIRALKTSGLIRKRSTKDGSSVIFSVTKAGKRYIESSEIPF